MQLKSECSNDLSRSGTHREAALGRISSTVRTDPETADRPRNSYLDNLWSHNCEEAHSFTS